MRRAPVLALPLLAVALLAGCAAATPDAAAGPDPSGSASAAPVQLSNCGFDESIDAAPKRVVSIKSTSTEMLLALGVGDTIVGTAFQDGPIPEKWAADAGDLNNISDFMPSPEAVLELEPDFVYSGWESAFAPDAAGDRTELSDLGIGSYVQPAACRSADVPDSVSFDDIFGEIQQMADIFRVDGSTLIDGQKTEVAGIEKDDRGLKGLWYSSGTDTPYVGAGHGAPQLVLDTIGVDNIASDVNGAWATLGWEAIVDADPDVIVLIDADWNTAASKIALLESNPATAQLEAVKQHRFLTLPFAASEAGVRTADAAVSLSKQLKDLDIP